MREDAVRREEMRKQKADLETKRQVEFAQNLLVIVRTMYLTIVRMMYLQYDKKKKRVNPDTIFMAVELCIIIKAFIF